MTSLQLPFVIDRTLKLKLVINYCIEIKVHALKNIWKVRLNRSQDFVSKRGYERSHWYKIIILYSHANETHFRKKGFALSLVLKVRVFGTRQMAYWHPSNSFCYKGRPFSRRIRSFATGKIKLFNCVTVWLRVTVSSRDEFILGHNLGDV